MIQLCACLLLVCGAANSAESASSNVDLRVDLKIQHPESFVFTTTTKAGQHDHVVSYFSDKKLVRVRAVPPGIYNQLLSSLPVLKPAASTETDARNCSSHLAISKGKQSQELCSDALPAKQRLAFATWYRKTREKILQ